MKIYLDFDGTVVEHKYPELGAYNDSCFEVLDKLYLAGHEIILNTYRADLNDGSLEKAIEYLKQHDQFAQISSVLPRKLKPPRWSWETHLRDQTIYIDDICPGIPSKTTVTSVMEIVDWRALNREFSAHGIYAK